MSIRDELTQEELKYMLRYNPERDIFVWIIKPSRGIKTGSIAGGFNKKGYRYLQINGVQYTQSRLVWLYYNGSFPDGILAHLDNDKLNTRIDNLADVTHSEVAMSQKMRANNSTGFKGVAKLEGRDVWQARIYVNKKNLYLGRYGSPEEAHQKYCEAALRHFGEYARF